MSRQNQLKSSILKGIHKSRRLNFIEKFDGFHKEITKSFVKSFDGAEEEKLTWLLKIKLTLHYKRKMKN